MSVQVETLENNMAKLTVEVPAEELEKAIQSAYQRQKSQISVPGFRKGKVPRAMIEKLYGPGVFYEEAANNLIPQAYEEASKESGLDIVSRPNIDVTQIEKGKPFIFTAEVATKPDVELGEYKGVEVTKINVEVSEEQVDAEMERERERNSRLVTVEDRPIEEGDIATIDYRGTIDGVPFDGGEGEHHPLEIGSGQFIPGFEEQLIGLSTGDEKDVEVSFPEDYHAKDLAGKAAVFHCVIKNHQKKELPELNDEFAEDVSEFDTLAEYRASIRERMEKSRRENAEQNKKDEAASHASANATIDVPEMMIETQADQMVDNLANNLRGQGMDFNQYMQFTNQTYEQVREQMKPQALQQIRTRLTLEKIAEVEKIEVTDEDLDAEIERMAGQYGLEVDKMKDIFAGEERENLRSDLQVRKAADFLAEHAVEVEPKVEEEAPDAEAIADAAIAEATAEADGSDA